MKLKLIDLNKSDKLILINIIDIKIIIRLHSTEMLRKNNL